MGRSGDLLEEDGSLRGCKPTIGSVLAFAREVSAIDFNNSGGISAGEQSLTSEALESLKGVVADDAMVQTRETEVFLDDALKKISSADSERKKLSEVFDDLEKLLDSISCSESNEKVNCALLEQAFGTE